MTRLPRRVVDWSANEKPSQASRGAIIQRRSLDQITVDQFLALLWLGLLILPKAGLGKEANDQLLAASEEHRRLALEVVIGGAGERCDRVRRTFFQGRRPNGEAVLEYRVRH